MLRETLATCTTRHVLPARAGCHLAACCSTERAFAKLPQRMLWPQGWSVRQVANYLHPPSTLQACWPHLLTLSAATAFVQTSLAHQNPGRTIRLGVQAIDGVRAPGAVGDGCPENADDEHGIGLACKQLRPADNRTAWRCLATGGSWLLTWASSAHPVGRLSAWAGCNTAQRLRCLQRAVNTGSVQPLKGTQACF